MGLSMHHLWDGLQHDIHQREELQGMRELPATRVRALAREAETVMRNTGCRTMTEYPAPRTPWLCRCRKCGRQITPPTRSVRQGQRPCRYCSRKAIDPEETRWRAMRNAGLVPLVDFPGVGRAWQCICVQVRADRCRPALTSIRPGQGCRYCAGQVVDVEFAENLLHTAGAEPLKVHIREPRSHGPCRCLQCGRTIRPRYNCVQQGQGPCRHCAKDGFDYDKPGSVYVLQHRIKGVWHDQGRCHERWHESTQALRVVWLGRWVFPEPAHRGGVGVFGLSRTPSGWSATGRAATAAPQSPTWTA